MHISSMATYFQPGVIFLAVVWRFSPSSAPGWNIWLKNSFITICQKRFGCNFGTNINGLKFPPDKNFLCNWTLRQSLRMDSWSTWKGSIYFCKWPKSLYTFILFLILSSFFFHMAEVASTWHCWSDEEGGLYNWYFVTWWHKVYGKDQTRK